MFVWKSSDRGEAFLCRHSMVAYFSGEVLAVKCGRVADPLRETQRRCYASLSSASRSLLVAIGQDLFLTMVLDEIIGEALGYHSSLGKYQVRCSYSSQRITSRISFVGGLAAPAVWISTSTVCAGL